MSTSLVEDRNYHQGLLERRATLYTLRISAPLNGTLFIIAPYGNGQALYSAPHDFPLSTTLLAWAEPYSTQEGAAVRAHTPRLKVLREDRALLHKRDPIEWILRLVPIIFYDSESAKARAFMGEYINKCYEAALRAVS